MPRFSRRHFLSAGAPLAMALAGLGLPGRAALAADAARRMGPPHKFSFDALRQRAKSLAGRPYVAPRPAAADILDGIDFDLQQKISFRPARTLWRDGPGPYPVRLFHLNKFNKLPVRINVLRNGIAREAIYSAEDFDYDGTALAGKLPPDLGYAGFRAMNGPGKQGDWLAFQGASYFRSAGQENQYGASARGIAVDTALPHPEEFPRFVEFWIAESDGSNPTITVYALMDGPSITGAYRFDATRRQGAIIDVAAHLFLRRDIERLGIAPLTSMYWYGENDRRKAVDWRPEIHDNDGLALWTGKGERIWRPLINPPNVRVNSFLDDNPKGFGLMQRDRNFDHYQDDSVFYEKRPSIWIEPRGDWGEGAVQLVEIPTDDEIFDNVVAFWNPRKPARQGDSLSLRYRMYWRDANPFPAHNVAHVVATRIGRGGIPGQQPRPKNPGTRFVIDFEGGPLSRMKARYDIKPRVTASRGSIANAYAIRIVGTKRWRAVFDVQYEGDQPIDLRCFLRVHDRTLTETWLYQYFPGA